MLVEMEFKLISGKKDFDIQVYKKRNSGMAFKWILYEFFEYFPG